MLNQKFPCYSNNIDMGKPKEGTMDRYREAVYAALLIVKEGKAPGASSIVAEKEWITKKVPEDWDMSIIITASKVKLMLWNKGIAGVQLLEHLMKVFKRIIEKYIKDAVNIDDR